MVGAFSIPGTPGMKRQEPKTRDSRPLDIEDNDIDELATDSIPCSSPFFTQPTQIISKGTQPTQIISKGTPTQIISKGTQPTQIINRTTLRQSSPSSPSTPSSAIEVPASSPFQPKSQSKPSPATMTKPNNRPVARGNIASLMAPAGTLFRPPSTNQASTNRPGAKQASTTAKAKYFTISDDDLNNDYKKEDSSGDEAPMRGDIRPSSFVKKDPDSKARIGIGSTRMPKKDIALSDIHDLRLRHLTKDVHKIVVKSNPNITVTACRDALQKGVGWQVSTAVEYLIGKPHKAQSLASSKSSFSKTVDPTDDNAIDRASNKSASKTMAQSNISRTTEQQPKPKVQSKLLGLDRFAYNKNDSQSFTSNSDQQNPSRRRLIQGRRNKSPSPPPVFSVSSSATSPPTSPANSQSSAKMTVTATRKAEPAVKRRRLIQGRRTQGQPQPITIDSDSDDDFVTTPAINSRKRKVSGNPETETATPAIEIPSEEGSDTGELLGGERKQVLDYLNSCSVDELSRMTGLPEDAKLMIHARPFKTLAQAEHVSRKEKSKSKRKSSRTEVGSVIVEKLAAWFLAFEAAATVIKECEERGATLQSIMSTWPMDKNGLIKPSSDLSELPISKKPSLMDADVQLKSYQLLGLNWMNLLHSKGYSGILADDMGLGKTCQVISFIAQLVDSYTPPDEEDGDYEDGEDDNGNPPWPNLIVVPPSTYENWLAEFERFAPEISVMPYYGSDRRNIDPEEARNYHVVLTTYTQVERQHEDLEFLQQLSPHAAIFDEGHKLKNPKTLIYKKMMRVPSDWRLILSGTPIQNNLKELLSVLHFVEPDLFKGDDFERLQTIFEAKVPSKDVHNFAALAKERVGNARTIMAPFILQRRKDDVIDLAKKIERNIVVGMHPDQKLIYDEIKGSYLHQPKTAKRGAVAAIKSGNSWIQLKKAAIHPQLFRRHFTDSVLEEMVELLWSSCSEDELYVQSKEDRHKALLLADFKEKSDFELHTWCKEFKKYIGHLDIPDRSWEEAPKVKKLLELVRGYMETGDRVLVFSRFEMVINILRDTLYFAGIPYCELTGQTNTADRFPEIQKFTSDASIPVFLLTTGAGGTGLNLTAANKIILFDQSDNPQDDVQASNRAHRIGQSRDVEVVRLITRDTVEGLIYNSCVKKLMLAACVEGQFGAGGDGDEETSVEEECRKLMLLESKESREG